MSQIISSVYRLINYRLKTNPQILSKPFMSTINSRNGHNFPDLLVPSKESLEKLGFSDLSSFTDSQNAEGLPNTTPALQSDDPFDPEDLVGIVSHQIIQGASLPTNEKVRVKKEPSSPPKANHSSMSPPSVLQPDLLQAFDRQLLSPRETELGPRIKSEFSSPMEPNEFKRPKILFSSPVRHFSTSNVACEVSQLLPETSTANASEVEIKSEKKRSRLSNLPNPTIQLATQRPLVDKTDETDPSEAKKVVKPIILSAEQEYVLQLAKKGQSIFFTGSAGTGKSVLLRAIIKELKHIHGIGTVAVTASTGLAACNIGGITLHSYAGFGLGKGKATDLLRTVRRNRKAIARWNYTKVLVIDEISMIDGALFQKLDFVARKVRRKPNIPFGGLQLIICGDFYQLPPVSKTEYQKDGTEVKQSATFAFESESWNECIKSKIILKEVFRQKGDQTFIDILNDMRHGIVSPEAEAEFARLARPLDCPAGIVPTELYATRYEVESANNMKLAKLRGSARVYESKDGGSLPPPIRATMLTNFLAPQKLFLKLNAQVMCVKNFDETLVNGSLGKVVGFLNRDTYMCSEINRQDPNLDFDEFEKLVKKKKIEFVVSKKEAAAGEPLDPETKQKITQEIENTSQTLLDSVFNFFDEDAGPSTMKTENETTENQIKAEAQIKSENQIKPEANTHDVKIKTPLTTDEAIAENRRRKTEFIQQIQKSAKGEKYPLVRFLNPDGVTTRDVLVEPELWEIEDDSTGEVFASRVQLPLMLAWALSIHKSQGQTLQKVKVDLTRIFENGQAYVALSRAVSREGLQVINFGKLKVRTHEIVEEFYESLSTSEDLAGIRGKDG